MTFIVTIHFSRIWPSSAQIHTFIHSFTHRMSVVGFDFGAESCVIAVARRRGIDVLQNDLGKRKTASFVAFSDAQRLIGDEGGAQYMSNYKNTFCYMKRFLGRKSNDPTLAKEMDFIPFATVALDNM